MADPSTFSSPHAADPSAGGPDWSRISHEVRCPLCDYNLYGLTTPRCPECGYPFKWSVILDPASGPHPYLIEHHTDRPIRASIATALGAMRPGRFWESLHPLQRSRPGVIIAYVSVGALLFLVGMGSNRLLSTYAYYAWKAPLWRQWGSATVPWTAAWQDCLSFRAIYALMLNWLFVCAWLPITFGSLSIFRISMKRAKVRWPHVLRCVAYSLDPAFWFALCLIYPIVPVVALLVYPALIMASNAWNTLGHLVAIVFAVYRLCVAYRDYLRFDHPFLTVMASQVVTLFIVLNVYFLWVAWL